MDLSTEFGNEVKTKARIPLMTGALGSTFIAAKYWDSFAVGGALAGIPIVIGENVVGVDRELGNRKTAKSPKPRSWNAASIPICATYDGYGAIIVQMNVEDTRNGVAEYVARKIRRQMHHRTQMGPGRQGYRRRNSGHQPRLCPVPEKARLCGGPQPRVARSPGGLEKGAIKSFARHSRLGGTNLRPRGPGARGFHEAVSNTCAAWDSSASP